MGFGCGRLLSLSRRGRDGRLLEAGPLLTFSVFRIQSRQTANYSSC